MNALDELVLVHTEFCRKAKLEADREMGPFVPMLTTFDEEGPRLTDLFTLPEDSKNEVMGQATLIPQWDEGATLAIVTIDAYYLSREGVTPEEVLEGHERVSSHPESREALITTFWRRQDDGTWGPPATLYDAYSYVEGEGLVWDNAEPVSRFEVIDSLVTRIFDVSAKHKENVGPEVTLAHVLHWLEILPGEHHCIGILRPEIADSLGLPTLDITEDLNGS